MDGMLLHPHPHPHLPNLDSYAVLRRSGAELCSALQLQRGAVYLYKCDKVSYTTLYEGGHFYNAMNTIYGCYDATV